MRYQDSRNVSYFVSSTNSKPWKITYKWTNGYDYSRSRKNSLLTQKNIIMFTQTTSRFSSSTTIEIHPSVVFIFP